MTPKPRPIVIHNSIERDNRLKWHPVIEFRHKGVLIYSCVGVIGYMQPAKAAAYAAQEMKALMNA